LRGISLVRRNSEWHHFDPLGTAGVITNGSASVVSNNLYDAFGVLRYTQGSAQTPWRFWFGRTGDEPLTLQVDSLGYYYYSATAVGTIALPNALALAKKARKPSPGYGLPGLRDFILRWSGPACIGCLASLALFIPYFADCGWPWRPGWRDCFNTYWDAFIEECYRDVFCRGALRGCGIACGLDAAPVTKWVRKVLKWLGSTH